MDKIEILRLYKNCKWRYKEPDWEESYVYDNKDMTEPELTIATPILRPMSAMTEKEEKEYAGLVCAIKGSSVNKLRHYKNLIDWYRDNSFDIDGLIESKQAEVEQ